MTEYRGEIPKLIVCSECGRLIHPERVHEDDMPDGVGFVLQNGLTVNACYDCILKHGKKYIGK